MHYFNPEGNNKIFHPSYQGLIKKQLSEGFFTDI